ncbi:MAG: hypothetical protein JRI68_29250 [Deltaproteobacteria bacterium]|nr:hypothetical protein [Deltaproteobacteria bacterium]
MTIGIVAGGCDSTESTEGDDEPTAQEVIQAIDDANYCSVAGDCADLGAWCPFECPVLVNAAEEDGVIALLNEYDSDCESTCGSYGAIECQADKCVATPF